MAKDITEKQAFIDAEALQESNGNYNDVNKKSGALGKYQVLPSNVAAWTKEALGKSLTPSEYLADPAAQDAVANTILGGYYDDYGPEGAAAAWYAGPANHDDYGDTAPQNGGPSIASYVQSVMAKMKGLLGGTITPVATDSSTDDGTDDGSGDTTTSSDPADSTSTATSEPSDWLGALDGALNPNVGGASLNPLKDASDVGAAIQLVAVRGGLAAVGIILIGAGLLIAFGPDIFGRRVTQVVEAPPGGDKVAETADKAHEATTSDDDKSDDDKSDDEKGDE